MFLDWDRRFFFNGPDIGKIPHRYEAYFDGLNRNGGHVLDANGEKYYFARELQNNITVFECSKAK